MEFDFITKSVRITVLTHPDHVSFQITGQYNYQDFCVLIKGLQEECLRLERTRALLDIREVQGEMPEIDRFNLGQLFAEVWGVKLKAGVLAPRDKINKLFENTAVNRYARVLVNHDEKVVLDWLLQA